jgi:hypothetical protein
MSALVMYEIVVVPKYTGLHMLGFNHPISMRSYPHEEPDEVADHPDNYGLRVLGLGRRITGASGTTRTVVHPAQPARLVSVEVLPCTILQVVSCGIYKKSSATSDHPIY